MIDKIGTFGRNHPNSGAFSYSTLGARKNLEADARNPNLYTSLEDLKDNRVKVTAEENIYDEIRQRQRTLQREGNTRIPFHQIIMFNSYTRKYLYLIIRFDYLRII